ncbi:MAG TPA: hypothetical protein PLF33_03225 [Bacilli bacterium]|nr:hypothetical protein [Bacilli bacterium]
MIEMNVISDKIKVDSLFLKKKNNIIVENYHVLQSFLSVFFDINNPNTTIEIGNKKIDAKKAYVLNLLDYESLFIQTSLRKGSLMFDYIIKEIEDKLDEASYQINQFLDKVFLETVKNSVIKYNLTFDIDVVKLVTQFAEFENQIDSREYLKVIKILLQSFIEKNPNKTIIVFTNENIIGNVLDDVDGIIIFNLYAKNGYNVFIDEQVLNFDFHVVYNHINLNWPISLERQKLNELVDRYINVFHANKITEIYDVEMYIAGNLFNQIMHIDRRLTFKGNLFDLDEPYREYIKSIEISNRL